MVRRKDAQESCASCRNNRRNYRRARSPQCAFASEGQSERNDLQTLKRLNTNISTLNRKPYPRS